MPRRPWISPDTPGRHSGAAVGVTDRSGDVAAAVGDG